MDTDYLSIVIEISACALTLIFGICQLVKDSRNRFVGNPFEEYDSGDAWEYTLLTERLWKINLFIIYATLAIYYAAYAYTFKTVDFSSQYSKDIIRLIIIVDLVTVFIKELFHNKLALHKVTEKIHRKFFDEIRTIYFISFSEIVLIVTTIIAMLVGRSPKINDICIVLLVIASEAFFCFFRILYEEETYIHAHTVNSITIAMVDGTEYKNIPLFYDCGETIRIQIKKNQILYLPKSSILYVGKEIETSNMLETIRKELNK